MMRPLPVCLVVLVLSSLSPATQQAHSDDPDPAVAAPGPFAADDWPWWRGPGRDGHARPDQDPPLKWDSDGGIAWKTPISGRGHGSPIVVGNRVMLTFSDDASSHRGVVCLDRTTGQQLWKTAVHRNQPTPPRNEKGTQASSTPACDGKLVFVTFLHDAAMFASALTLDGRRVWQTRITDYVVHQGYGSSPAVHGPLVIVSADTKAGGSIAALDRVSGRVVWQHDRPKTPNYPSPIVLDVAGRKQLIMTGCNLVSSFDPLSGRKLWETDGATTECVTSTVTDGSLVFTSGGYPNNHVSAVAADGSARLVWENSTRVYVPSMLVHSGSLYAVADAGIALCWKCDSGDELWKGRLRGTFSSSPVLVGDRIYVTNETAHTFILSASPEKFEILAENQLGDECFATPAICGGRIYARLAHRTGESRQEFVYCLAKQSR